MKIQNNKGFSLIELSIVLIIMGLLVAGVTSGASLIKSARIRSIITEAEDFRSGINTYYGRYDRMPTYGLISGTSVTAQQAWQNLQSRKIVEVSATGGYVPAKYTKAFWTFTSATSVYGGENTLAFVGKTTSESTTTISNILTADDAYIVVKKMDAGKAVGNVVTVCKALSGTLTAEDNTTFETNLIGDNATTTVSYVLLFNMDEGSN